MKFLRSSIDSLLIIQGTGEGPVHDQKGANNAEREVRSMLG